MKRKIVSEENFILNEEYVIRVFKIVAFYGFDTMDELSLFSTISKSFYDWMNQHVLLRGVFIDSDVNDYICNNFAFPRPSLLKTKKKIFLYRVEYSMEFKDNFKMSFFGIAKDRLIYHVYYDSGVFKYDTLSYFKPSFDIQYLEDVMKFKFYANFI